MPSKADHRAKALANDELSLALSEIGAFDWSVTVMFYAALHWVDAYLASGATPVDHPRSHSQRSDTILDSRRLQPLYMHYRELEERSKDARYDCITFERAAVERLRTVRYEAIRAGLEPLAS